MEDLPLLSAGAMREVESHAMKSGAITAETLMERASAAVIQAIWRSWPGLAEHPGRALVLCGPGHNGGDGYGVARGLVAAGWQVDLFASGPAGTGAAAQMAAKWAAVGSVAPLSSLTRDPAVLGTYGLVVDAIFGSGLSRPFQDYADLQISLAALARAPQSTRPVFVAIDLPSGLCADSGRVLGAETPGDAVDALRADLTVTFETPFLGHMMDQGPTLCGELVTAPLGPEVAEARRSLARPGWVTAITMPAAAALRKSPEAHKYTHGHALILAGPMGQGGAAQLAARAALRIGAGLVTVAPPGDALLEHALGPVAALMQKVIEGAPDLSATLRDPRINALCLGPGLGRTARSRALVAEALAHGGPTVLDADALRVLAEQSDLRAQLHPKAVLTPHEGEFAALCPQIMARLNAPALHGPGYSRVDAAREAARALGAVVVLKGPSTVVADPDGQVALHGGAHRAAPDLATAGSGDVLAGMITGLLARGHPPFRAARMAVWLHAELARSLGPGLIADDLVEALPALLAEVTEL